VRIAHALTRSSRLTIRTVLTCDLDGRLLSFRNQPSTPQVTYSSPPLDPTAQRGRRRRHTILTAGVARVAGERPYKSPVSFDLADILYRPMLGVL
jgi:hypothetical protein